MAPLSSGSRNPLSSATFLPEPSVMDMDLAHYLLTEPRKGKENPVGKVSPAKETYGKLLAEKLLNNRIAFRNKPPEPESMLTDLHVVRSRPSRQSSADTFPRDAEKVLDAPELVDDYCLNLLDWGSSNVLSIVLGSTVYLCLCGTSPVSLQLSLLPRRGLWSCHKR